MLLATAGFTKLVQEQPWSLKVFNWLKLKIKLKLKFKSKSNVRISFGRWNNCQLSVIYANWLCIDSRSSCRLCYQHTAHYALMLLRTTSALQRAVQGRDWMRLVPLSTSHLASHHTWHTWSWTRPGILCRKTLIGFYHSRWIHTLKASHLIPKKWGTFIVFPLPFRLPLFNSLTNLVQERPRWDLRQSLDDIASWRLNLASSIRTIFCNIRDKLHVLTKFA